MTFPYYTKEKSIFYLDLLSIFCLGSHAVFCCHAADFPRQFPIGKLQFRRRRVSLCGGLFLSSAMRLFIAEKPSVAKAIAAELGIVKKDGTSIVCQGDNVVTWCFGHLLEQVEPDYYLPDSVPKTKKGKKIWRMQDLPIFPKEWLTLPKADAGVKKQLSAIGKLIKSAKSLVNAGDPDREGQLLVDEVIEHFKSKKPVERFWVSAVDPASIRKGLQSLKRNTDYVGMRDAARARSRADWLIGMNLSRAYTLSHKTENGKGDLIAVGRVQTPTLTMVARRDYAVNNFKPQPYYAITADLNAHGTAFSAKWKPSPTQSGMDEEGKLLLDIELGKSLVERLNAETQASVLSCETKHKKAFQPKAYSLADIQIEANRLFGYTAEETLNICQSLYETHKVTSYPRTDCGYLPESQHGDASRVLQAISQTCRDTAKAVAAADPSIKSPTFNDKKITAHHGIVPVANIADWSKLSDKEQNIYKLVAKRYIAQFFPAHEYDATEMQLRIGNETFTAKGKTVTKKGWKLLYSRSEASDKGEDAQSLPVLVAGDIAAVTAIQGKEAQTTPPAFFTEGSLIAAMENIWRSFDDEKLQQQLKEVGGIGTPATRAAIIAELKHKKYLVAKGKALHCSELGRDLLTKVSPRVRSAKLTAQFEEKLQLIENGEMAIDLFLEEYEKFILAELGALKGKK